MTSAPELTAYTTPSYPCDTTLAEFVDLTAIRETPKPIDATPVALFVAAPAIPATCVP